MEFRTDNPCDRIGPILGAQNDVVTHMRALPHRDVASAIETVRGSGAQPVVKLAFEFVVLTAARWGEVRGAEWAQIDRREGVWTIPATRMKAQREHRVPLCRRATEILSAARKLGDGSPLVFTRGGGKPLYEKRLRRLLRNCKIAAVPHGFRSSFRDWAAEETDHPREVIEAALAHVVQNKVEAAYRRTDLFERRLSRFGRYGYRRVTDMLRIEGWGVKQLGRGVSANQLNCRALHQGWAGVIEGPNSW